MSSSSFASETMESSMACTDSCTKTACKTSWLAIPARSDTSSIRKNTSKFTRTSFSPRLNFARRASEMLFENSSAVFSLIFNY